MPGAAAGHRATTLVVSQRTLHPYPWYSSCVEHQDVVRAVFDADLALIEPRGGRAHRVVARHQRTRRVAGRAHGLAPFSLSAPHERYDLVIFIVNDLYQLAALESLPGWRELGDRVVVFINEMWPPWFEDAGHRRLVDEIVHRSTRVVVTIDWAAQALRAVTDSPIDCMLPTVDVLAAVSRVSEERRIDVANLGRRSPQQHAELVRWTDSGRGLYLFDTAALAAVDDHAEHRRQYSTLVGRSRLFISNLARFNQPELRGSAREYGLRYIEALAGGALIAGEHPSSTEGAGELGPDVRLFDFPIAATCVPDEVRELVADRDAAEVISRAHRITALERHDVLHRWTHIADAIGVPLGAGAETRAVALRSAAAELRSAS